MSLLLVIWLLALSLIVGIIFYARIARRDARLNTARTPQDWSEFVHDEVLRMYGNVGRMVHVARPHGERAMSAGIVIVRRGHDLFIERVFGRMSVEKGKASSFFLKQITESKRLLKGKDGK